MCKSKCLLIIILIRFIQCSDKYPYQAGSNGVGGDKNNPNDEENNLELIEKELENILTDDESNTIVKDIQKIVINDSQTSPHDNHELSFFTDDNTVEDFEYHYSTEQQYITRGITQPISCYQNWSSLPCYLPATTEPPLPIPVSQLVIQQKHEPYKYPIQRPYDPNIFYVTPKHFDNPEQKLESDRVEKHKFVLGTQNAAELSNSHLPYESIVNGQRINTGPGLLPTPTFGLLPLQPGLLYNPPKIRKQPKYIPDKQSKPIQLNLTVEVQINVTKPQQSTQTTQQTTETTEQSTEDTTKHTTEQTTQQATEDTQQHTQHTQLTELHPETIPVELGSDEEDESPQEPKGSGSDDKPPDKPPDKPEKDEKDDGEEGGGEKGDVKTPKIPSLDAIVFYKKGIKGNLVRMDKEDYNVSYNVRSIIRFEFYEKLEKIMYIDEVVYKHMRKKEYITILIYNKYFKTFTGKRKDEYFIIKKIKNEWIFGTRKIPNFVHFFTKDDEGNDVLLGSESYNIELSAMGSIKFIFLPNVKCIKVMAKTQLIWEKENDYSHYPTTICVTDRQNILVYFYHSCIMFGKTSGKYNKIHHKNVKNY